MNHSYRGFKQHVKLKCHNIFKSFKRIQFNWKQSKQLVTKESDSAIQNKQIDGGEIVQLVNGPILYIDEQNANWRSFMQKCVHNPPQLQPFGKQLSTEDAKLCRRRQMRKNLSLAKNDNFQIINFT